MMNDGNRQPAETPAWQQKRGRQAYVAAALAAAKSRRLTPAMVRALSYRQVAELCGVAIGPNGESPLDFFYQNHRRHLANRLQAEVDAAEKQDNIDIMSAALASKGKKVVAAPDGRLKIEDAVVEAKK